MAAAHGARCTNEVLVQASPEISRVSVQTDTLPGWLRPRLTEVLGPLEEAEWSAMAAETESVDLPAGAVLFEAGQQADDWYVVLAGRFSIVGPGTEEKSTLRLAEVGAGELLGELATLTGQPRTATVSAVRDSRVLRIGLGFVQTHWLSSPPRCAALLRHLALRLVDRTTPKARVTAICTVLLPAGPSVAIRALTEALAALLADYGRCLVVGGEELGAAVLSEALPPAEARQVWMRRDADLDRRALDCDHLLLLGRTEPDDWTRQALQRADQVLVLADAQASPQPLPHEADWLGMRRLQGTCAKATLVLIHPADARDPRGTAEWLAYRGNLQHRHLRAGDADSLARLARHVDGRGVALALSGGGARCFAQLGVVQAMRELGLPIDGLAGTSGGAMSGALIAQQLEPNALRDAARRFHEAKPFQRGTLPLVSLRHGKPIEAALQDALGDRQIEDLWLPLVMVSSNLTRAQPHIHRHGSLFEAVRASASLPGILPPWLMNGELLVDGGLVDNLPVELASQAIGPRVLAVDVTQDDVPRFDSSRYPSPWQLLAALPMGKHRAGPPGLLGILMHSLLLSSLAQTRQQRAAAQLCLQPPLSGMGMLSTGRWEAIIDAGYRHALEVLAPIREQWR